MPDVTTDRPVVTVTDAARALILESRAAEAGHDELALRLDVTGQSGVEYAYELTFEPVAGAGPDDALGHSGELPVLIPAGAVDKLRGATLDHADATGLVLRNPNRPQPGSAMSPVAPTGEVDLEGTMEERLAQLLDGEINPQLAMHGGFAAVDRIDGDTAYLTMGGGCQGCGLAQLTLTEGIKAIIEDRIPEIAQVVDVTDHAAGTDPFYEPSK
ncbi:MAG: NifU family protein [Acidimicrobiales bacterium]